jgi:signal transduction histidine kinase
VLLRLLPQSLFGRLFAASLAVIVLTLLTVVLLIARERRDLAFLGTGAWNTTKMIADTSENLARLRGPDREAAIGNLREHPLVLDDLRRRRPAPDPAELAALQNSFASQLRRELGDGYGVTVERASPEHDGFIRVDTARMSEIRRAVRARGAPGLGGPPPPPPDEDAERDNDDANNSPNDGAPEQRRPAITPRQRAMFLAWRYDVTVRLPDGEQVMFRTPVPFVPPPLPTRIFVELAVLTGVLGLVLFLMALTITRPLRDLATAADAMGRGVRGPPLAESGARELRRATRAFNTMQERLRRYLDSRTRVLAAMSHDLRTTLTRLRLRAETIENDDLRTRFSADLDEMAQMVQGALALFRDLNDDEPLDAVDVVALLTTLRNEFAEMDADVTIDGHTQGPISAKPLALKRCLTNLLHNAIKYGTRATVLVSDGDEVVIRIRDQGPGIPAEALDQVFEPFFRVEASRNRDTGGAGLGLSIARDIAQAHGGSIALENLAVGGLEVTLTLPRAASAATIPASQEARTVTANDTEATAPATSAT